MKRETSSILLAAALLLASAATPALAKRDRIRQELTPATGSTAVGRTRFVVRTGDHGRFELRVWNLTPLTDYEIVVGGVRVGSLTTKASGFGRARFRTRPRGRDLLLGFDPRGQVVSLRDAAGLEVLSGAIPSGTPPTDGDVICCIPDDSGAECEDRTPEECAAQGGTLAAATSCLPNPCPDVPPTDADVVCCVPDDSGPECEDRTVAECAAEGGVVVEATSCAPNPCAATSPAGGDDHGGHGEVEPGDDHGGRGGDDGADDRGGHGGHGGDDAPESGGGDDRGGSGGTYY